MFHNWPWTNLHEINLDWVVKTVKEWHDKYGSVDDAIGLALQQVEQARTDSLSAIDGASQLSLNAIGELQRAVMEAISAAGNGKVDQITAKGDEYLQSLAAMRDVLEDAVQAKGEQVLATIPSEYTDLYNQVQDNTRKLFEKAPAIQEALFGDMVHFADGAANYPFDNLRSHIEPKQAGSGTPSPSNIRPISGWNEVKLSRTGKNLLRVTAVDGTQFGLSYTVSNGEITVNGTASDRVYVYLGDEFELPPGTYTMSGTPSGIDPTTEGVFYDDNHNLQSEGTRTMISRFTVRPYLRLEAGVTFNNAIFRPQIEYGNRATQFFAYRGEAFTNQTGQTVYGGQLDWKTGILTVTHYKIIFDGVSDGARVYHSDGPGTQYGYLHPYEMRVPFKQQGNISSNKLVFSDDPIYSAQGVGITTVLWLKIPVELTGIQENDRSSVIIAKTNNVLNQWYEAGEPLEVVYELAAPTTIQLTPKQILSFYGENNLWSNTGKTSAYYFADTKLYINNKVSALLAMNN